MSMKKIVMNLFETSNEKELEDDYQNDDDADDDDDYY